MDVAKIYNLHSKQCHWDLNCALKASKPKVMFTGTDMFSGTVYWYRHVFWYSLLVQTCFLVWPKPDFSLSCTLQHLMVHTFPSRTPKYKKYQPDKENMTEIVEEGDKDEDVEENKTEEGDEELVVQKNDGVAAVSSTTRNDEVFYWNVGIRWKLTLDLPHNQTCGK